MNALSVIIRAAASRLAVLARKRALGAPVAALSLALALVVVAGIQWSTEAEANDRRVSAVLSPQSIAPGTPTTFTLTVTVTSGDRAGTVIVFIPDEFTAVDLGSTMIVSTPVNKPWNLHTCSAVGDSDADGADICATAKVDQDDTLLVGDAIVFSIDATTPASGGSFPWRVQPMQGNDFNGPEFEPANAPFSNPTATPTMTDTPKKPTKTPTPTPTMTDTPKKPTKTPTPTLKKPTKTPTPTKTPKHVHTPTPTPKRVHTPTPTPKHVHTPTKTPPHIHTPTPDVHTPTKTPPHVHTPTNTPPHVHTPTYTPTPTRTGEVLPTVVGPTPTPRNIAGDVNCDGEVNSRDTLMVLQQVAFIKSVLPCIKNADVNQDGRINSKDAALILQYHVGRLDHLPV